jgi:hypothetical protein
MPEVVLRYPQILQRRTWYGINANVTLKSKFVHKAGYGNLLIPHPAAVNWLLRRGLKMQDVISLGIHHFWLSSCLLAVAGTLISVY